MQLEVSVGTEAHLHDLCVVLWVRFPVVWFQLIIYWFKI